MKKNYLLMMAMLLFAAIGFTGCSDDDDKDIDGDFETLLVGTWVRVHSTGYETVDGTTDSWDEDEDEDSHITFYSDGTGIDDEGYTWTWKVTGNTLTMWWFDDENTLQEDICTILTLTETKLVVYYYEEDEDGNIYSETVTLRKS